MRRIVFPTIAVAFLMPALAAAQQTVPAALPTLSAQAPAWQQTQPRIAKDFRSDQ